MAALAGCVALPARQLVNTPAPINSTDPIGPADSALDPASIALISWNIEKAGNAAWSDPETRQDMGARLAAFDLILIQEACLAADGAPARLGPMLAGQGYGWRFATSFASALWGCRGAQATGVALASRTAPLTTRALRSAGAEFSLTPKASLVAEYALAGRSRTLLVVNTHMLNFELLSLDDYRRQLEALTRLMASHRGPLIFAGDLNTRNQARLNLLHSRLHSLCLRPLLPTPPDTRSRDRLHDAFALDHVFYRGLQPLAPLQVGDEARNNVSDHNSIAARFAVGPGPGCAATGAQPETGPHTPTPGAAPGGF